MRTALGRGRGGGKETGECLQRGKQIVRGQNNAGQKTHRAQPSRAHNNYKLLSTSGRRVKKTYRVSFAQLSRHGTGFVEATQ